MDGHDRQLAVFLAGELDPAAARQWDAHLLECDQCWQAVREDRAGRGAARLLRQPAPPGLADRIGLAVEVAAATRLRDRRVARPPRHARASARSRWRGRAGAGALAAGAAVALGVFLLPAGRPAVPAAVTAVARYAHAVPMPSGEQSLHHGEPTVPVEVGRPRMVTAGGQRIVIRTWRLGGVEAVVAVSGRPFPMPPGAARAAGGGMAWSARLGGLSLYCRNGRTSELVAAPVPAAELAALAARLPIA